MGVGKGILNGNLGFVNGIFSTDIFKRVERICNSNFSYGQNCRIIGIGRDPWRSSGLTSPAKASVLQHTAQESIQMGLEYLWRRRLHNLSEQLEMGGCLPSWE